MRSLERVQCGLLGISAHTVVIIDDANEYAYAGEPGELAPLLPKVCEHCFGPPRRTGGSDAVFKIPWPGDRRVNIQNSNSQAKAHQRRQVSSRYEQEGGDVMETIQGPDVSRYTYRVTWSVEDGEFVATCAEFPSLSWLADSQAAALQGLVDVVADAVADLVSQGEAVPEPLSERSCSGKFNLRVGEGLHRRLAIQAAEEHLSLNQYVVQRLSGAS
jgi:predicted HicB family RNase H-like nuclease